MVVQVDRSDDIFSGCGIEIRLQNSDDFLKVKETLTRIGVAAWKEKKLYQSCHILHKRGHYAIVHFKELFKLDGKPTTLTDEDIGRRNSIATLLDEWGLVQLVDRQKASDPLVPLNLIKVLPFKEKDNWSLIPKYQIGKK